MLEGLQTILTQGNSSWKEKRTDGGRWGSGFSLSAPFPGPRHLERGLQVTVIPDKYGSCIRGFRRQSLSSQTMLRIWQNAMMKIVPDHSRTSLRPQHLRGYCRNNMCSRSACTTKQYLTSKTKTKRTTLPWLLEQWNNKGGSQSHFGSKKNQNKWRTLSSEKLI